MREILFRGKHAENGKWVYGNFMADALESSNDLVAWGFIKYYDRNTMKSVIVEIDRNTLGQYTGLKDKNGNKIFEGDLMEWTSNDIDNSPLKQIDEVRWKDGGYVCGKEDECLIYYLMFNPSYESIELAGNIHDKADQGFKIWSKSFEGTSFKIKIDETEHEIIFSTKEAK